MNTPEPYPTQSPEEAAKGRRLAKLIGKFAAGVAVVVTSLAIFGPDSEQAPKSTTTTEIQAPAPSAPEPEQETSTSIQIDINPTPESGGTAIERPDTTGQPTDTTIDIVDNSGEGGRTIERP
jgi:hypothetical protein